MNPIFFNRKYFLFMHIDLIKTWWLFSTLPQRVFYIFKDFIYLCIYLSIYLSTFRDRGERRGRGRETPMCERNIKLLLIVQPQPGTWPAIQARALTGK